MSIYSVSSPVRLTANEAYLSLSTTAAVGSGELTTTCPCQKRQNEPDFRLMAAPDRAHAAPQFSQVSHKELVKIVPTENGRIADGLKLAREAYEREKESRRLTVDTESKVKDHHFALRCMVTGTPETCRPPRSFIMQKINKRNAGRFRRSAQL